MFKGKLKIFSAFIAIAFLSVAIMLIGLYGFSLARAAETTEDGVKISGIQMRGVPQTNDWYCYLVIKSEAYKGLADKGETFGNEAWKENFSADKVRLYKNETDEGKTLAELGLINATQNRWGENGAFIGFNGYNDGGYGGSDVYKVEIEKGCRLPVYNGEAIASVEVGQSYTYINADYGNTEKKFGAYNWNRDIPVEKQTVSLSGVQMRGAINGWYYYLVLQSEAYKGMGVTDGNFATTNTTFDKIRLYTSADDTTGKPLSELTIQHVERNFGGWTDGLFINYAEYDSTYGGHQVYKIVIEKGCELLADSGEDKTAVFVVDKNYTYINGDYGDEAKKLEATNWTRETKTNKLTISLSGVQMRGAINGWYYYLVLQSEAYKGMGVTDGNFAKTYTSFDKIRLYTSEEDTVGKPLSELTVQHVERNFGGWTDGLFINYAEYDNGGFGGHQVYKIVIEKGCELLADSGEETTTVFVVDKEYSFVNGDYGDETKKLEATNWGKEVKVTKREISLSGVQMRGIENGWYYYLVLQSEAYKGMGVTDGNFAKTYTSFDKIRLYTSEEDTVGKPLSELTVQHVERNFGGWTDGLFINYAEYDNGGFGGHQVYKIVIEKGCELLAETAAESATVFVTDEEYVYYNQSYGYEKDKLGAYEWTDNAPLVKSYVKAAVSGVQMRGWSDNGWYQFLVIRSEAFEKAEKAETVAFWKTCITEDKIVFYTKNEKGNLIPKKLSELTVQHVGASFWDTGSYINYAEYAEELNGQTVYKVEILKGCEIPIGESDGKLLVMRVDDDYTFFNNSCGSAEKRFENFDWSVYEIPQVVENTGTIKIETVTNQCGDNRYVIIRLGDAFSAAMSAKFFADKNLCNTLDKILIYSGNDLSAEPVTLRSIWTGEINLRQYGSPSDIGFSILNEERLNGTNMYAVKILKDCEFPFVKNGEFGKKTVDKEYTFVNSYYGKSGDIPGSYDEQYQTPRKYENFAVEWQKAAIIEYKVIGIEGLSFKKECLAVNSAIDFSAFAKEGYDLSAIDDLGYTYYGKIIVPAEDTVITLKYTAAEKKDDDKPAENSSCKGAVIGGEAWLIVIAVAVIFAANKKKSIKR